jgi:shikimate kinase
MCAVTSIPCRFGDHMTPTVVLIGAPGSGKTSVGTRIAQRMAVPFRDTDVDVERRSSRTISDIFIEDGEAAFREMEHTAVLAALAEHDGVLALGGGAVVHEGTRAALRGHRVIWLRVGLAAAASRVGLNRDRPMLLGNVRGTLLRLLDERAPLYAQVSAGVVDTDSLTIDETVDAVITSLNAGAA